MVPVSTPYPTVPTETTSYDAVATFILDARAIQTEIAAQAKRGGAHKRGASGRETQLSRRVEVLYLAVVPGARTCTPLPWMLDRLGEYADTLRSW